MMVDPICGYDADGKELSGYAIRKRDIKIKTEILYVLARYKLTVGQASAILSGLCSDFDVAVNNYSVSEAMPRLSLVFER
ncbi:MAG: hypothetical protein IJH37_05120 [Clostridia bacterium]|nr:hypothetical protein [Clostridia bacterium]